LKNKNNEQKKEAKTVREAKIPEEFPLSLFCPNDITRNPISGKAGISPISCIICVYYCAAKVALFLIYQFSIIQSLWALKSFISMDKKKQPQMKPVAAIYYP